MTNELENIEHLILDAKDRALARMGPEEWANLAPECKEAMDLGIVAGIMAALEKS